MAPRRTNAFGRRHPDPGGRPAAFTLIELLVVIAIIALLMAVLVPSLQATRKRAKAVVCQANLKRWGTTLALYAEEHEGRLPRPSEDPWSKDVSLLSILSGLRFRDDQPDPNRTKRYWAVRTEGIACCPMAVRVEGPVSTSSLTRNGQTWLIETIHGSTFTAWQRLTPARFRTSYGLNKYVFSFRFDSRDTSYASRKAPYTDIVSIPDRGGVPVLLDAAGPYSSLIGEGQRPPKREPSGRTEEVCINRHNGTINGLFLDWSVRQVGLKELWTLKWHLRWNTAGPWTKAGGVKAENWPPWMRNFRDY